jgi:hypothetical protein
MQVIREQPSVEEDQLSSFLMITSLKTRYSYKESFHQGVKYKVEELIITWIFHDVWEIFIIKKIAS